MERSKHFFAPISLFIKTTIILFILIEQTSCWGSIYPRGSISKRIGDDVEILCSIDLIKSGKNSSFLSFFVDKEEVSKDQIQILNETSILLTIQKADAMSRRYTCKLDGTDGVDLIHVYIGSPPGLVHNFKCRSYDYDYMICRFTMPDNFIRTTYNLTYRIESQVYICPLEGDGEKNYQCNISLNNQHYRPVHKFYNFTLYSNNTLGTNVESFIINNYNSVIPAKFSINVENITTHSADLGWINTKLELYKSTGLKYEVKILSEYSNGIWEYIDINGMNFTKIMHTKGRMSIRNLQYPFTRYDISMRKKVASAPDTEEMWSIASNVTFRTLAKRPDQPPEIDIGSFHIDIAGNLYLYWKQLEKYEENGPNLHYIITEVKQNDKITNITPIKISSITAKYELVPANYEFTIKSNNSEGQSETGSTIRVPSRMFTQLESYAPQRLKKVLSQGRYTLSWTEPKENFNLVNYTVFWCISKGQSFNQCEGSINFSPVNKEIRNFTYETKDIINFAVSANTLTSSSGMVWAICTLSPDSDFDIMTPTATAENATSIKLYWNLECVNSAILQGYNLIYCRGDTESTKCKEPEINVTIPKEAKGYYLTNLEPFTTYRIRMSMFSLKKNGPLSKPITQRTLEAAPTAPKRLIAKNITSNSVLLSWERPQHLNGILKYYEIWYNNDHIIFKLNETNETQVNYTLDSLKSFYNYKIYVIAYTIAKSEPSNDVNIKTSIGIPGSIEGLMTKTTLDQEDSKFIITWNRPVVPSGPINYYELKTIVRKNNGNSTYETISKINGTRCRLRQPLCLSDLHRNVSVEYEFFVRAVNTIPITSTSEFKYDYHTYSKRDTTNDRKKYLELENSNVQHDDHHNEHRTSTILKRHSNAEIDHTPHENYQIVHRENRIRHNRQEKGQQIHMENGIKLQCIEVEDDDHLKKWLEFEQKNYIPLHGEWSATERTVCSPSNNIIDRSDSNAVILGCIFIIVFVTISMYFVCKKYRRMKNIVVVFPPGLTDLDKESRIKGMDNIIIKDDIARSDESLFKNENHHLLASSRVDSGYLNGIDCSEKSEVIDYETACREQINNNNNIDENSGGGGGGGQSDSVELSDMSDSSNTSPTQSPTINIREKSIPPKPMNNLVMINGYVQHQSFQKPPPPPESASFGYTQLDAFGKPILPNITNNDIESKHKDINSGANENICGYVTHKQLSEFGHRLQ